MGAACHPIGHLHRQLQNQSLFAIPPGLPAHGCGAHVVHTLSLSTSTTTQYGEFRAGYNKDQTDTRVIFFGLRYVLDTHINKQWTRADVDAAARFFRCALQIAVACFGICVFTPPPAPT